MKVTFDSNTYRRVTDPDFFSKDVNHASLVEIREAISDGRVVPFFSATLATLEGIRRKDRGAVLSSSRLDIRFEEDTTGSEGTIRVRMTIGARYDTHPGIPQGFSRWLEKALDIGFLFLPAPRLGQARPEMLNRPNVMVQGFGHDHVERFGSAVREIEERGVGIAVAKRLGESILKREDVDGHWTSLLDKPRDDIEAKQIERAVGEWSDGDLVAAHIGFGCDVLCSEDSGRSADGASIFDADNRLWLAQSYGVVIETPVQLAARLPLTSSEQ